MTGNMASSRAGVTEGVMRGMTQDRLADVGSQLYQNAANQAAQAGLLAGQGNLRSDLSTQGDALTGYINLANQGIPGVANSFNTGKNLIDMQLAGGRGFQAQDQMAITDEVNRFNFNQQAPYQQYADIFNIMSGTIPGGAGVGYKPNPLDQALQGALVGAGIWQGGQEAGWWGQPQNNPLAATPTVQPALPGPSVAGFSSPPGGFAYNPYLR
jgi:hypothetical protein